MVLRSAAAVRSNEICFGGSHQKQRDSSRLTATNKNPRNLFGLEASKIAHILRWQSHRDIASRHFGGHQNVRRTGQSESGQSGKLKPMI